MGVLGCALPRHGNCLSRLLHVYDAGGCAWRFASNEDLSVGVGAATARRTPAPRQALRDDALLPGLRWLSPTPQGDQLTAIDLVGGAQGWAVSYTHLTLPTNREV